MLDINGMNRSCNCDRCLKTGNNQCWCWWDGNFRQGMRVCELKRLITKTSYTGKTQRYCKVRTMEHMHDVWKVIAS